MLRPIHGVTPVQAVEWTPLSLVYFRISSTTASRVEETSHLQCNHPQTVCTNSLHRVLTASILSSLLPVTTVPNTAESDICEDIYEKKHSSHASCDYYN